MTISERRNAVAFETFNQDGFKLFNFISLLIAQIAQEFSLSFSILHKSSFREIPNILRGTKPKKRTPLGQSLPF